MANIVYIACSLDGFIADRNNSIDWLMRIPNPDNSDYGFADFMERIDGILMGRKTFETVAEFGYWPYNKPVFVLTSTMNELPEFAKGKAKIVSGALQKIRKELKRENINNLYVDGGKTIQSFLKEDMIDEMIIARISILLGGGFPLFGLLEKSLKFKMTKTEVLNEYIVKNYYKRARGEEI